MVIARCPVRPSRAPSGSLDHPCARHLRRHSFIISWRHATGCLLAVCRGRRENINLMPRPSYCVFRPTPIQQLTASNRTNTRSEVVYTEVVGWLSGNIVWRINEVIPRRAALVLRWVIIRGYTVFVFNQATQANSAWPSFRGQV